MATKRRMTLPQQAPWTRAQPSGDTRTAVTVGGLMPTAKGPSALLRSTGTLQQVHLRQGDMDGACGPYAVIMGLLALGLVDRDEVTGTHRLDGRKRYAKLWRCFSDAKDPLLRRGTDLDELREALEQSFPSLLQVVPAKSRGAGLFKWAQLLIEENVPAIVGFDWQGGGGHAALVVGYECDHEGKTDSLLLLDPGAAPPRVTVYNATIRNVGRRGTWPYEYMADGESHLVSLDSAIALRCRMTPPA